jgi:hypothetical protein
VIKPAVPCKKGPVPLWHLHVKTPSRSARRWGIEGPRSDRLFMSGLEPYPGEAITVRTKGCWCMRAERAARKHD